MFVIFVKHHNCRYHLQHWVYEHSCNGYYRNGVCVLSSRDAGTIIASGAMIANKARTDYDPILSPCMADIVEKRRKSGGRAPVTTKLEPALCKDMQRDAGGGWDSVDTGLSNYSSGVCGATVGW